MFDFIQPKDGPVFEGFESREKVFAKDQPQYIPLRTLQQGGKFRSVLSRWTLTDEQRKQVASGADIFLELSTFGQPLQPIRMAIGDGTPDPEWVAEMPDIPKPRVVSPSPFKHGEAFCLMTYATKDGTEKEIIWNSRDGVTPFIISSRNGKEMTHVEWNHDTRVVDRKPSPGERIFVDATEALVKKSANSYVEKYWDLDIGGGMKMRHTLKNPTGAGMTKGQAIDFFIAEWTKPGSPCLVEVQADGTYKHAD